MSETDRRSCYGIGLVNNEATKETFGDTDCERAPPPISGQAEFDRIESSLRDVRTVAWARLWRRGTHLRGTGK